MHQLTCTEVSKESANSVQIVWNELKNIVFTCFQRRDANPQKGLGQSSKYPKLMLKITPKLVPKGGPGAPF